MFNKDVLMKFIASQQQTQPMVSNEGFLNGAPPAGMNYRIPSDTLYNPTPHRIKAVSDNGIEAELQPYDETNVHFPGAQYVDEYEMRYGGLNKFIPMAQTGTEVKPNLPDLSKPLSKNAVRVPARRKEDSVFENIVEFADPSGITSWDDAKQAYEDWMKSGNEYPTAEQALSMFSAVPALGKFGKIKYLDKTLLNGFQKGIPQDAYKYIPWQDIINFFGTSNDIQNDNMKRVSPLPVKATGGEEGMLPKAQEGLEYLAQEYNPTFNWRNFSNAFRYKRGEGEPVQYGTDLTYGRGNFNSGLSVNRSDDQTDALSGTAGYAGKHFNLSGNYSREGDMRSKGIGAGVHGEHFNLSGNYGRQGEARTRGIDTGFNAGRFSGMFTGAQTGRDKPTGVAGVGYEDSDNEINAGLNATRTEAGDEFAGNFAVKGFNIGTRMNKDTEGQRKYNVDTAFSSGEFGMTAGYERTPLQESILRDKFAGSVNLGKYFLRGDVERMEGDPQRWSVSAGKSSGPFTFSAGYNNIGGGDFENITGSVGYNNGANGVTGRVTYNNNGEADDTIGGSLEAKSRYVTGRLGYTPGENPQYTGNLGLRLGPVNIGASGVYQGDKLKVTPTAGVSYTFKEMGGLHKFIPKAQPGLEVKPPVVIPADAARYGVNAQPQQNMQYADPDLVNRLEYTQKTINEQSTHGNPRVDFEQKVLNSVNKLDGFDVSEAGYLPEHLKDGNEYYCISGVCYTLNDAGEPIRFYSNSLAQDDVAAGKVPNWKLNYDLGSIQGGDILQFTGDRGTPHHAGLVVPNSIVKNEDGTIGVTLFMNNGDGRMYQETYNINPKTDVADNGETTQLLTRDFGDSRSQAVNIRDWLKNKIMDQDPQFFTRKKGAKSRWETYSPGMFTEKGKTWVSMDGEPIGVSTPTMMQNQNPDVQAAGDLLKQRTLTVPKTNLSYTFDALNDVDYNALSKTAGFNQILNKVNDEQFKLDFMKRYNISNREYNAIVSNTFGIYGQESGFGTKPGGLDETDAVRKIDSVAEDIASRFKGKGSYKKNVKEDYSRGLTQVKLNNLSKEDREKYGITPEALDNDPEKAFLAAMIVNAQNLPQLRRLAEKGETSALDGSNYLDFLPYMYNMPGRLRRGDKKTIEQAIKEGESPEEMVVRNPNSPYANNEYLQNVRAYANLFQHSPTTSTLEIKAEGGMHYGNPALMKFVKGGPKRKSVDAPEANYQSMNNADQRSEYEAGWKAYSQGAQQWIDMLNKEEERKGRELTADEKEKFIEKFVKPGEGQRKFKYDRASDRRFDFLFDEGYTTWSPKDNAPVYNLRKPLNITADRGEYAPELDRFAKEWMSKENTGFAKALGFNANTDKRSKNRAYDYARTKVAEQILASNPQGDRNRVEWMKSFSPEQLDIIQNSQAGYNLNPDMGTQFRQGMANLFGMDYNDEDLTPAEAKQASRLGALAPLGYTSNLVRGAISGDLGTAVQGKSAKPMTYGTMESYVQPESTAALEELALAGMDPQNIVGIGLLDDTGRAGKVGQVVNAGDDASDASLISASTKANLANKLRRYGYKASVWEPKGKSALAKFIKDNKSGSINEHLYGLGHGLADMVEGERPFSEIFPVTKAQRERIWAKQDAAVKEGEDFVKDWIYGPDGEIRSEVVDRAVALDPGTVNRFRLMFDKNSTREAAENILNTNPSKLVSSRTNQLMKDASIPDAARQYIAENRGKILGVNNPNYNITLRNQGFYQIDPRGIANTSAHETGHTFQKFGDDIMPWSNAVAKFDYQVTPYYFANHATPSGKMFGDAMVEPNLWADDLGHQILRNQIIDLGDEKLAKLKQLNDDVASGKVSSNDHYDFAQQIVNEFDDKIKRVEDIEIPAYKKENRRKVSTWEASPKELHSELMVARMNTAKRYVDSGQFPDMESAIQYMQNPGDDVIDYMITDQGLNRFFKGSTDADTKRKLIRMLPAAVPAIGAGMMMNDESTPEGFAFGGALSKFVGGGEHGGLDRWFAEKWVDVKTGKPCGRQEGDNRSYPACRPSKRVSEDTPKTSSEMSPSEKAKFKRTKTSSKRIPYNHKRD